MERVLMQSRLPAVQAFYTLGIELPAQVMQNYFVQGLPELIELSNAIMD